MGRGIGEDKANAKSGLSRRGRASAVYMMTSLDRIRHLFEHGEPDKDQSKFNAITYQQLSQLFDAEIFSFTKRHGVEPLLKAFSTANDLPVQMENLVFEYLVKQQRSLEVKQIVDEWLDDAGKQVWNLCVDNLSEEEYPHVCDDEVQEIKLSMPPDFEEMKTNIKNSLEINEQDLKQVVLKTFFEHVNKGGMTNSFSLDYKPCNTYLNKKLQEKFYITKYSGPMYPQSFAHHWNTVHSAFDPYHSFWEKRDQTEVSKEISAANIRFMTTIAQSAGHEELIADKAVPTYIKTRNTSRLLPQAIEEMASWDEGKRKAIASLDGNPDRIVKRSLFVCAAETGPERKSTEWLAFHVAYSQGWSPLTAVDFCHNNAKEFLSHQGQKEQ